MREDPTGALERDLALIEPLDVLRFDEAWVAERIDQLDHMTRGQVMLGAAAGGVDRD